jgi:hypothetical protein
MREAFGIAISLTYDLIQRQHQRHIDESRDERIIEELRNGYSRLALIVIIGFFLIGCCLFGKSAHD